MARPLYASPPADGSAHPLSATVNVQGPVLTHPEWLATLKTGSIVLVRNGRLHFRAPITDATPCFLHICKLKFHRRHGWQVKSNRAYRQALRLVRTEDELK